MKWYKYREIWAGGRNEWKYADISNSMSPKPYFDTLANNEYSWSEHFRKLEWKKIKTPPLEYLQKRIRDAKFAIFIKRDELKQLKSLVQKITRKRG